MDNSSFRKSAGAGSLEPDRRSVLKLGALGALAGTLPFATAARAETSRILVGSGPVLATSGFEFAVYKGYFKNEGLDVRSTMASSGAATLAGVLGGSLQFAVTNVTSTIIARSRGLAVSIVAPNTGGHDVPDNGYCGILVKGDSKMSGPLDLQGKTVAVNAINSVGTLVTARAVEKAGGDYKTIKWVELPQGDAVNAVAAGQVDAIYIVEPFVTIGKQRGLKYIFSPYYRTEPNFAESVLVAGESFLTKNPKTAASFASAMKKSNATAAADPNAVRASLQSYMKISSELIKKVSLPEYPIELNETSVANQIELAQKYGYITKPVSIKDLLWLGA